MDKVRAAGGTMIIEKEDGEDITIRGGQVVKGDVEPGVYRLVICLDVEAYNLEQAYERVYDTMGTVDAEDFQWESTDEAFDPEGDAIDPDELQEARMKVFARKNENTCEGCGEDFTQKDIDGGRCLSCGRMIS